MYTAPPTGPLLFFLIAGTGVPAWFLWSGADGWSLLASSVVAIGGVFALQLLWALVGRVTQLKYTGWQVEAGPTLAVTYTSAFGLRAHSYRDDLSQVRAAHIDSLGRLVMRAADHRVVAWMPADMVGAHPDLTAAIRDALREGGATVTSAPSRSTDELRTAARDRAERMQPLYAEELEAELEQAMGFEGPPLPRRAWDDAKMLGIFG